MRTGWCARVKNALGIARAAGFAEFQRGGVGFVGIEQVLGELGGFAETHRQQAGGERIEHTGMAGFFGAVKAACFLQRSVARYALRFVE